MFIRYSRLLDVLLCLQVFTLYVSILIKVVIISNVAIFILRTTITKLSLCKFSNLKIRLSFLHNYDYFVSNVKCFSESYYDYICILNQIQTSFFFRNRYNYFSNKLLKKIFNDTYTHNIVSIMLITYSCCVRCEDQHDLF